MSKDDLMKKWEPIIDSMGVTGSKADWLSQYAQILSNNESKIEENTLASDTTTEFPSLLPISMQVASKTIGMDLVNVKPLASPGMSQEEVDRINNEVKKENRDGKIDALIDGKDFKEMNPEKHPDWKPGPTGKLFYMDFKYGSQNEEKEEDESPIKGRRGPRKKEKLI
jgi:hypothetical protein